LKSSLNKRRPILIIGAGGQARVVLSIVNLLEGYEPMGILDINKSAIGEVIGNSNVIGGAEDMPGLKAQCNYAALAIGDNRIRSKWADKVEKMGFQLPTLIHPTAIIETNVNIGRGSVICAGAIVCCDANIGPFSIINTGAQVDHECRLGKAVHLGPGALLAGRVNVEEGAFVGVGTVVKEKIKIGSWCVIGAGSLVIKDMPSKRTAYGSPAKVKKS